MFIFRKQPCESSIHVQLEWFDNFGFSRTAHLQPWTYWVRVRPPWARHLFHRDNDAGCTTKLWDGQSLIARPTKKITTGFRCLGVTASLISTYCCHIGQTCLSACECVCVCVSSERVWGLVIGCARSMKLQGIKVEQDGASRTEVTLRWIQKQKCLKGSHTMFTYIPSCNLCYSLPLQHRAFCMSPACFRFFL